MHFYMVTPEFRATEMVCETIENIPVCNPVSQTTDQGKRFFELDRVDSPAQISRQSDEPLPPPANMPLGFDLSPSDAVIHMGMHCFEQDLVPATPEEWTEPSLIYVSYGSVIAFEPMIPFIFVEGDVDHSYSRDDLTYVQQSIPTLPSNLKVEYSAATGITTTTFQGKSKVCKADFDAAKEAFENPDMDPSESSSSSEDGTTPSAANSLSGAVSMSVLFVMSGFLISMLT